MSVEFRVFEAGPGRALDIAGIEADLASLWKEASSAGQEPAMRATRVNLIVLLEGMDRERSGEARLERLLPAIARGYPSRLLVVHTDAGGDSRRLTASVSALCTLGGGARYVCCEKITIRAGPGAEASVPGTILALLIGELPVVTWLPAEPPLAASWFRSWITSTDRVLFDSSAFAVPSATFRGLAHLTASSSIDFSDFEWERLAPWRRSIAGAFEDEQSREAARRGFERVLFTEPPWRCAPGDGRARAAQCSVPDGEGHEGSASAASLLLRAWIERRVKVREFEWECDREAAARGKTPVTVSEEDASRGIRSIRFEWRKESRLSSLEVPPPCGEVPLPASELVRILGGQEDYPLSQREN